MVSPEAETVNPLVRLAVRNDSKRKIQLPDESVSTVLVWLSPLEPLPSGRAFDIPRRDHMLAVGDKAFKAEVLRFLAEPL